jgi:hypothetical protein
MLGATDGGIGENLDYMQTFAVSKTTAQAFLICKRSHALHVGREAAIDRGGFHSAASL